MLRPSSTGLGAPNTACAGKTFQFSPIDLIQGKYAFTWTGTIILTPTGATKSCIIQFTTDVLKMPTKDANGTTAGIQTDQASGADSTAEGGLPGGGTGSDEATVVKGTIGLTTLVNPDTITLGASFQDTATLTLPSIPGLPTPTGTMTFTVYKGNSCTVTPAFGPVSVPVTGLSTQSPTFTPTTAGTYRVVASYSGDVELRRPGTDGVSRSRRGRRGQPEAGDAGHERQPGHDRAGRLVPGLGDAERPDRRDAIRPGR